MKTKKLISLALSGIFAVTLLGGCSKDNGGTTDGTTAAGNGDTTTAAQGDASADAYYKSIADIDVEALKGTTVSLYTHGGNRVLGEEKKDADGNTYRDESYAYLKHLADKFTEKYGITVDLQVVTNEDDIRPLLQVGDPAIDIYTCPNWSVDEYQTYAEPYCTIATARDQYGDYADTMYKDNDYIYALMPSKTYNNAVVYNEETIKSVGYDAIPATKAEFEALCQALRDAGIDPIAMHRVENWPLATIQDFANYVVGSNDAFPSMLKSDTPFNADQPMGQTIRMYTEWKSKGFFESDIYTDFGVAMDVVGNGKAGMMLFGAWVVPQIQGRVPEGGDPASIKFAPAPDFGNGRYVMAAAADSFSISKTSDNKDAARLLIEYIAEDAQFAADSGFIANKKGVTPVVPELYSIIDAAVEDGSCKVLYTYPMNDNWINTQNVLTEADIWGDYKYAGNLFDAVDVTKPDDWSAYDAQVTKQNEAFADAKSFLAVEWKD